jgi:hypothetical protein
MKTFLLATLAASLLPLAQAQAANCGTRHEKEAGEIIQAALLTRIAQGLAKKGIHLKTVDVTFSVDAGTIDFDDTGSFVYTDTGYKSLKTSTGSELIVNYIERSDFFGPQATMGRLYDKAVGTQKGFDKEGNPIDAHCMLVRADGHVQDQVYGVEVSNSVSEKILLNFTQPSPLKLY